MAGSLQRTRGFRVERVKSDSDPREKGSTTYTFRANDGEFDRYQDRLSVKGWDLRSFNANPVILYNHDAGDGGFLGLGRKDVLPIGKGRAYVQGDALYVDVQFDQTDEFAKRVESKVEQGILNAVSVRYTIPDGAYTENEKGGLDSTAQELLEISIVTIPGNQRALRVKGSDGLDPKSLVEQVASRAAEIFTERLRAHPTQSLNTNGDTMTPEQIAQMQKNAVAEAMLAFEAKQKADEAAKAAKLEAEKAAEIALQARVDEAVTKIMGEARGQRSGLPAATPAIEFGGKRAAENHKGLDFARLIKARTVAKMNGGTVIEVLKGWDQSNPGYGYGDFAKALSSGSFSGMGSLIKPQFSSDFIDLLRNKAKLRAAGARVVSMGARLEFDGQSGTGSAQWGGETDVIAASNPTTSRPLTLTEKKLTALAVIPNDLIRNASISAEQFVLNDLLQVVALEEDLRFLYGTGTLGQPLGLVKQIKATATGKGGTHVYAMTALGVAGKPTVLEMKTEIDKALKKMELDNAPMEDVAIFTSPSPKAAILDAVAASGDGSNMLEAEYNARGTLRGRKFFVTNQISELGTTDTYMAPTTNGQSDLIFLDMSEVIIGESMDVEAEVFPNGTWVAGGVTKSGIATDQSVIRLVKKVDCGLRHTESGARVTGVTWGN